MARLGVMTTEFPAVDLETTAARIAQRKIGCVQLQLGSVLSEVPTRDALLRGLEVVAPALTPDRAGAAHHVLAAHGLSVAAVDGTYNLAHPDPSFRARNLDRLVALIELASAFGTDIVTVCTGTRSETSMWTFDADSRSDDAWRALTAQLSVAVRAATRAGVTLAFEPEHNNVVDTAQRARQLIDEIDSPSLQVLMDAANLFGHSDLARQRDHLTEAFALLGDHIALAHAKDLDHDGDAGGRAAGQGLLDYPLYLRLLQESGFDGAIVLHQLSELAPDRIDEAFDHVRASAPDGYVSEPSR